MPAKPDTLDILWEQATAEASSRGFRIYPGAISIEAPSAMWPLEDGIPAFLDLAKALGKEVVYINSNRLTPQEVLDSLALALEDPQEVFGADTPVAFFMQIGASNRPEMREYLELTSQYYGRRTRVSVEWAHEGIVHRFLAHADWHTIFIDRTADVAELVDSMAGNGGQIP
ncbi:MAG TPA: hypothetical protein VI729_13635 [Anaerolineales bacterium]|nr:hypothetical protein [Anaerolineales bacterium]